MFTALKFKWKASADSRVPGCDMNVMGRTRESVQVQVWAKDWGKHAVYAEELRV